MSDEKYVGPVAAAKNVLLTKAALDKKLDKTGGTITGSLKVDGLINAGNSIDVKGDIDAEGHIYSGLALLAPTLGLNNAAEETSVSIDCSGDNAARITSLGSDGKSRYARLSVGAPTGDNDAATKAYVDSKSSVVTTSANGLMSAADKVKLDGVEAGANKTTVDAALDAASENPVQNKAVKSALDGKLSTLGGEISGYLEVGQTVSAEGSVSVGRTSADTGIHFEKAASDAGRISHGSDAMTGVAPIARLKVATPTEDDDAATKAYVDGRSAGSGAVRYDTAQSLTLEQKNRARLNIGALSSELPVTTGPVSMCPANVTDSYDAVHVTTTKHSGDDFTLTLDGGPENALVRVKGIRTPTDADTNAAATVEYVNAKVASGAEVYYIDLAGTYPSYTCATAMADIAAAYASGKELKCRFAMGMYTAVLPLFMPKPGANTWIFSGSGALAAMGFPAQSLTIAIVNGTVQASDTRLASMDDIPTIPTALKNPNALTIKIGSTTVTYDGSAAKTVEIADGSEVSY